MSSSSSSLSDLLIERVTLTLGGLPWRLVVTYRVLLECQDATGIDMLGSVEAFVNPTATSLRALLYALLKRCDEEGMYLRRVGELLKPENLAEVEAAILRAYVVSLPDAKKKQPTAKNKDEGKNVPPPMGWMETRAAAHVELRLSGDEWLDMSMREFHALREAHVEQLRHWELIAGQIVAAIKNHSMNAPKKWAQASDFVFHRLPVDAPERGKGAQIDSKTGAIWFEA